MPQINILSHLSLITLEIFLQEKFIEVELLSERACVLKS